MISMRDVAKRAGVSPTTVSFVLNGRQPVGGPISKETQERVLAAAREMGYRRNSLVQAVVRGHNRTFGFLARHLWHEFTARVIAGALEEARVAGYGMQILQLKSEVLDREAIESCLEMRLAGLLTIDMDREALEYLRQEMKPHGVPIAFIDTSFRQSWGVHVTSDDVLGCQLAIAHLVELGHKRIAFIGGQLGRGMAATRDEAYHSAMREQGLEVLEDYVRHGGWNTQGAQECAHELLSLALPPTAIFCASDEMAVGVQRAARQRGVQMPRDLSVVGFSNLALADMADPPLTTVNQPKNELGQMATRLLLEKMKKGQGEDAEEAVDVVVPTQLVVRESTAFCSG